MKIKKIETILLGYQYGEHEVWRWSGGVVDVWNTALVRVQTDSDIDGVGEVGDGHFVPEAVPPLVSHFGETLVGYDPLRITDIHNRLYKASQFWGRRGLAVGVISGIEMALWDISGKAFGVPVHQLLGGKQRDRLRVYASGGMEKPAEELRQEIAKYIEMGFTGVKIRGGYSVEKDLKILALAKETAGNKADVMIDVGQNYVPNPWSTVEAIKACGKLGELDPYWIEEPFCTDNPQAYAQVTRSSNVPIAGGENAATLHEFRQLIDNNAIDIVQPDASHAGGVWETLKIANYAKIHGKSMAPHNFRSGVTLAAHLHILASISNALILEYQTIPNPLRTELLIEPLEPHKGWIDVPDLPGLGVLLTDRLIEKYPFKQGKVQRFKIEQPG